MYRLRYDSRLLCIGTIRYGKSHIGIYIGIASNWVYCIVYIVGHTEEDNALLQEAMKLNVWEFRNSILWRPDNIPERLDDPAGKRLTPN